MQLLDEPFADASILPTYRLSELASRSVKVVLGGDGGDELFAGYPAFQAHKVVQNLSFLPVGWRDWLGYVAKRLPVSYRYTSTAFLAQQFVNGLGLSAEARFLLWMGYYSNADKKRIFTNDFHEQLMKENPFEDIASHVEQSGLRDHFQRLLYLCTKMYFQDDILMKVDMASMAHSLEVRVPYMDLGVLQYACRIQPYYKLRGLTTKYVLKRAMRGILPADIIHRRKAGFMLPVAHWLSKDLRETVEDLCSSAAVAQAGIFDGSAVRRMLDEHFQRRRDHRKQIYPLVCFMAWLRRHGGRLSVQ
jgi:asparagine synthase (glutamine-hydrolysing)